MGLFKGDGASGGRPPEVTMGEPTPPAGDEPASVVDGEPLVQLLLPLLEAATVPRPLLTTELWVDAGDEDDTLLEKLEGLLPLLLFGWVVLAFDVAAPLFGSSADVSAELLLTDSP